MAASRDALLFCRAIDATDKERLVRAALRAKHWYVEDIKRAMLDTLFARHPTFVDRACAFVVNEWLHSFGASFPDVRVDPFGLSPNQKTAIVSAALDSSCSAISSSPSIWSIHCAAASDVRLE